MALGSRPEARVDRLHLLKAAEDEADPDEQ